MPARDGTGPYGTGPAGHGFGPCGGSETTYDQQFGMGRAHRWGRRFGNRQGWGRRVNPAYHAADSEIQSLQNRLHWLKEQLDSVTRELEERSKPSM